MAQEKTYIRFVHLSAGAALLALGLASGSASGQPSLLVDLETGVQRFGWTDEAWEVPGGYLLRTVVDSGFVLWWAPAGDPSSAIPILDEARSVAWDIDRLLVGGRRPGDAEAALWSVRGPEPELLVPGVHYPFFADRTAGDLGPAEGFLFVGAAPQTGDNRFGLWRYDEPADSFTFLGPSGFPFGPGIPEPCRRAVALGSVLLYCGGDAPWVSDGTPAGTAPITPPFGEPGATGWPIALARTGSGRAFFTGIGEDGPRTWVTDGTPEGTTLLEGIAGTTLEYSVGGAGVAWWGQALWWGSGEPVAEGLFFAEPDGSQVHRIADEGFPLIVTGSGVVARREGWDGPCSASVGCEPWFWDQAEGWRLLADLAPGPESSSTSRWVVDAMQRVLFAARTPAHGWEAWVSTQTPATAAILVDLEPGPGNGLAPYSRIVPLEDGSMLVSRVRRHHDDPPTPWKIGPSGEDFGKVADLVAGTAGSGPEPFAVVGDQVLFWATVGGRRALWRSDATAGGTRRVVGAEGLAECGRWTTFVVDDDTLVGCDGGVYHLAKRGALELLGRFQLAPNDTLQPPSGSAMPERTWKRASSAPSWGGRPFARIGSRIVGAVYNPGSTRLASLDLVAQTEEVLLTHEYSVSVLLLPFSDRLYFSWRDETIGGELWVTDGTAGGTAPMGEILPGAFGSVEPISVVGDGLILRSFYPDGYFWSDGSLGGTRPITGVENQVGVVLARPDGLCITAVDGSEGKLLWIDAEGEVSEVAGIPDPYMDVVPAGNEALLLPGYAGPLDLWRTDCTAVGTRRVATLTGLEATGKPLLSHDAIWLAAADGGAARLLRVEGSTGDTTEVGRWTLPVGSIGGAWFWAADPLRDVLLFSIADERYGRELWSLDLRLLFADGFEQGTTAGWSTPMP
jgi:ELWxxDGT repeat protein